MQKLNSLSVIISVLPIKSLNFLHIVSMELMNGWWRTKRIKEDDPIPSINPDGNTPT